MCGGVDDYGSRARSLEPGRRTRAARGVGGGLARVVRDHRRALPRTPFAAHGRSWRRPRFFGDLDVLGKLPASDSAAHTTPWAGAARGVLGREQHRARVVIDPGTGCGLGRGVSV